MERTLYLQNMNMNSSVYHIYVKNKCLYHSLPEEKFNEIWKVVNDFAEILEENDIEYLKLSEEEKNYIRSY